jgi:hypothetical protein
VQRFGEAAREKAHRASVLATKLWKQTKEQGEAVYRVLNERLQALEALGVSEGIYRAERKKLKAEADAHCKVALANLAMWVRDRFFPATYAHATWLRLLPFFQLPGHVRWDREVVQVELRPFNNRQLNRDLLAVCQQVKEIQPRE